MRQAIKNNLESLLIAILSFFYIPITYLVLGLFLYCSIYELFIRKPIKPYGSWIDLIFCVFLTLIWAVFNYYFIKKIKKRYKADKKSLIIVILGCLAFVASYLILR